jgi:hypothetical protein
MVLPPRKSGLVTTAGTGEIASHLLQQRLGDVLIVVRVVRFAGEGVVKEEQEGDGGHGVAAGRGEGRGRGRS